MPLLPNQYALPDRCCMCLGPSELTYEASSLGGKDGHSTETRFKVPLCQRCLSRVKRQKTLAGLSFAGMAAAGGYAMWGTEGSALPIWYMALAAGGLVIGLLGLLVLAVGWLEPVSVLNDRIVFRNKQYQRLFEEANQQTA